MRDRLRHLYLAFVVYIMSTTAAFADDDHFWSHGGRSHGPVSDTDLAVSAAVSLGAFAVSFAALFFIQGVLAGVAFKFAAVLAFFGPLAWALYIFGALAPSVVWFILFDFSLDYGAASGGDGGNSLYQLLLFVFLCSILYHYILYMLLGLFSKRQWGKTLLRLYCLFGVAAGAFSVWRGSAIGILLFVLICLAAAWIAWRVYEKRAARLAAKA